MLMEFILHKTNSNWNLCYMIKYLWNKYYDGTSIPRQFYHRAKTICISPYGNKWKVARNSHEKSQKGTIMWKLIITSYCFLSSEVLSSGILQRFCIYLLISPFLTSVSWLSKYSTKASCINMYCSWIIEKHFMSFTVRPLRKRFPFFLH